MPIRVVCECGKRLKAPDAYAGRMAECPGCGRHLVVPPLPIPSEQCVNSLAESELGDSRRLPDTPQPPLEQPIVVDRTSPKPASKLAQCKACGKDVSKNAPTCPHCGESAPGLHIKCPTCGSLNIATGEKGFGLGKAAVGLVLLGPVGLLGGMLGRKRAELVCQACGKKWKPEPHDLA